MKITQDTINALHIQGETHTVLSNLLERIEKLENSIIENPIIEKLENSIIENPIIEKSNTEKRLHEIDERMKEISIQCSGADNCLLEHLTLEVKQLIEEKKQLNS